MDRISSSLPIETFKQPESVVTMRVGPAGQLLGPCDNLNGSRYELFRADSIPKRLRDGGPCVTGPLQAAQPPAAAQPAKSSGRREDVDL